MPAWNELIEEFQALDNEQKQPWIKEQIESNLQAISLQRGSNVILYGSAFLQKPEAPPARLQITHEDLNSFMSVIYGMDWNAPLTLILHTPGGVTNAAESIVAYFRAKFQRIEVVIPTFAMSAGTMISLGADRIVMGRQSQLGPIDPQMPIGGRYVSARAIVDQFARAKAEILSDVNSAHVWAVVLQSLGPSLLQEAQNALDYGEQMVAEWLAQYMFVGDPHRVNKAQAAAQHFNDAASHKSHGRRIARDEARSFGILIEDLEEPQDLQENVLTAYHLMCILFDASPVTKLVWSNTGRTFVKNWSPGVPAVPA
jgi:hypothetical protein